MFPGDDGPKILLIWLYAITGTNLDEAIAMLEPLTDNDWEQINRLELGWVFAMAGQPEVTLDLIEKTKQRKDWAYIVAIYYGSLGETDNTLLWLEKTYEIQPEKLLHMNVIPQFAFIRSDPRFTNLMRRVGFPDQ